jgi:CrcB protein
VRTDRWILVAIAAGGALGAPARYAVARALPASAGRFPWATFLTNVSGSFALGLVVVLAADRRALRAFLATGILGAFTTFSTFTVDADLLVRDGRLVTAAIYVAASLSGGAAAVWSGIRLARVSGP